MERAKIFWSGRSQAVRLPKNFRFPGKEVRIRRHGNAVILEPVAEDWAWLDSIAGRLDDDLVEAVDERPAEQKRPALQKLFRRSKDAAWSGRLAIEQALRAARSLPGETTTFRRTATA